MHMLDDVLNVGPRVAGAREEHTHTLRIIAPPTAVR